MPFGASVMEIHSYHIPTKIRNWTVVFDVESTVRCRHAGSFHFEKKNVAAQMGSSAYSGLLFLMHTTKKKGLVHKNLAVKYLTACKSDYYFETSAIYLCSN
jgi:hypothetical protein